MSQTSHYSLLILMLMGMSLLSPSCTDDNVNLNPRMEEADLPDEIPYSEMGSGKLLFTRGYISYLIDIDNHSVSELVIDPVGGAVLSPDGETVAFVSIEEKLHLWNIVTNNHETTPFGNGDFNLLSWSPNGSRIAFIGMEDITESHVYIVDVFTQELTQVSTDQGVVDRSVYWSK